MPLEPASDLAGTLLAGAPGMVKHTFSQRMQTCMCEGHVTGARGMWVLLDEVMDALARALEEWQVWCPVHLQHWCGVPFTCSIGVVSRSLAALVWCLFHLQHSCGVPFT